MELLVDSPDHPDFEKRKLEQEKSNKDRAVLGRTVE